MDHIPLEQLERYSRDEIEPERVATVEEHLLICQECRDALDRLEEEACVMREALQQFKNPEKD
jgi:predicted anti-sigma-YlaC factor YlaD